MRLAGGFGIGLCAATGAGNGDVSTEQAREHSNKAGKYR
jgi:hypothetical protein